jgi:hypothetical protein
MATMTDNDPISSTPLDQEPAPSPEQEPEISQSDEGPGYLAETGHAVGEDGTVVPIIGGLPAAEGSAWDIGASLEDRGAGLAERLGNPPEQASHQDPRSN